MYVFRETHYPAAAACLLSAVTPGITPTPQNRDYAASFKNARKFVAAKIH
jgi:hypothetical protein